MTLELIHTKTPLEEVYPEILKFQQSVFGEVLKYDEANNFAFSPKDYNSRSFLVCPLIQLGTQKWDFDLECLKSFISQAELSSQNDEFYLKRVVSTRHSHPGRFFHIITMDTNTTLASPFTDTNYSSYANYFTNNYNYKFKNEDLSRYALEAINVSGHVNLITSR